MEKLLVAVPFLAAAVLALIAISVFNASGLGG